MDAIRCHHPLAVGIVSIVSTENANEARAAAGIPASSSREASRTELDENLADTLSSDRDINNSQPDNTPAKEFTVPHVQCSPEEPNNFENLSAVDIPDMKKLAPFNEKRFWELHNHTYELQQEEGYISWNSLHAEERQEPKARMDQGAERRYRSRDRLR
jgi:hypothetical protein